MCIVLLQERQNVLQQDSERAGSSSKYQDDVRVNILVPVLTQRTENIPSFSSFCSVIGCGECSIEVNVGLNRCAGGGGGRGVHPITADMGRLHPKGVPFSTLGV